MIRIIAGTLKGRQVVGVPKDPGVRPISGRIRQSVFDIWRPRVPGCRFLDLYAGSGSVGLEALSRGAAKVVFVEHDRRCVEGIRRNLERFGLQERAEVLALDVTSALARLRGESFELVYCGPPYKDAAKRPLALTRGTLEAVAVARVLAPGGSIACQHHRSEPAASAPGLELARTERYGDTLVDFFKGGA